MPPRQVHGVNDRNPLDFFWALPPITRTLLATFLITGIGSLLSEAPLYQMYLQWPLILGRFPPQLWRLVLNFAFIGRPSIGYLFHLVWLVQYGGQFERAKFSHSVADSITMLGFGMAAILGLDAAFPFARIGFHGLSLLYYLMYGWSRVNASTQVSFMGVVAVPGLYMPFLFLVMDLVQGASIAAPLLGIASGHLYYFLTDVYPRTSGRRLLHTPQWLARAVSRWRIGPVPIQQVNPTNPSDFGFRAFSGRGRRLVD